MWAGVTAAAAAAAGAVPGAWEAARPADGPEAVTDVLVAGCAAGLALALAWLWATTTVTVVGVLTGTARAGGGTTRRLVLVACGAAALAGVGSSAVAAGGEGPELLVGLALPERAVAPPHRVATPAPQEAATETYVVRPGDSLWSIARLHRGDAASVDVRWRAICQANRHLVGDDPDLIHPGQVLHLPGSQPHRTPDGDR